MNETVITCRDCGQPPVPGYHHCQECLDKMTLSLIETNGGVRCLDFSAATEI